MSTNYSPRIVTSNLVLCLDGANTKSYPGSGTDWFDLSGNDYDATLTTTSFDGESIYFDGTSSLCRTTLPVATLSETCTVCFWFARGDSPGSDGSTSDRIISTNASGGGTKWCIGINTSGNLQAAGSGGGDGEPTVSVNVGTYYYCAFALNSTVYDMFVNDTKEISSEGITLGSGDDGGNMSVGCRPSSTDRIYHGNIALVLAYNRVLSDTEIERNYDCFKGRFGL